jgi:hypothetical protein
MGVDESGNVATWQAHFEGGKFSAYWGHYHMQNKVAAASDFAERQ